MEELIAKEKEIFVWDIYKQMFLQYLTIVSPSKENPFLLDSIFQNFIRKANPDNIKVMPLTDENKQKLKSNFAETLQEFKSVAAKSSPDTARIYDNFKIYAITLSNICVNHEYAHEFAFNAACKSRNEYHRYLNSLTKSMSRGARYV